MTSTGNADRPKPAGPEAALTKPLKAGIDGSLAYLRKIDTDAAATGDARAEGLDAAVPGWQPRFDGLYMSERRDGDDGRSIVRFLDSREVLTVGVGSMDDAVTLAGQVARWLAPGHPYVSQGRYERDGAELRFVASSSYGRVSYTGCISQDGLEMRLAWHSDINGNSGAECYHFVPVPELSEPG